MELTERKIGAIILAAGLAIFYPSWSTLSVCTEHIGYADPPPPDAVLVVRYYDQVGIGQFRAIAVGLILISAGATLILRYTLVRRMETLDQSYPHRMDEARRPDRMRYAHRPRWPPVLTHAPLHPGD